MPLVAAKCPGCGGDIQVDNSRKEAFCSYCGTKFLVESAVNYYNTKNEYHIDHADIKMEDSSGLETRLKNAESYLVQHKEYKKAEELFKAITEEYAGDWRAWWGVVRAITHEFTGLSSNSSSVGVGVAEEVKERIAQSLDYDHAKEYYMSTLNTVDAGHKTACISTWEDFERRYRQYVDNCFARVYDQAVYEERVNLQKQIDACSNEVGRLRDSEQLWRKMGMIGRPFYRAARKKRGKTSAQIYKLEEQRPITFKEELVKGFVEF